jgi:hypothetical protein
MSWSTMAAKDRRAIILGAIIVLPGLIFIWGIRPYRNALTNARDELVTARLALSREMAAVAAGPETPGGQQSADSALRMVSPRLFEGRDDAFASAQLAAYLGSVARRSRVLMEDANTRPSTTSPEGIRTLRVEVRAESDVQGVATFLHNLEAGSKLVRVDRLEVSRVPGLEDKNGFETLTIAATIAGFAFNNPGDTPPPAKGAGGKN